MLADIVSLFSCFAPSVCFHLLYLALSLDRSLCEAETVLFISVSVQRVVQRGPCLRVGLKDTLMINVQ